MSKKRKRRKNKIRKFRFVKFCPKNLPDSYLPKYPFKKNDIFVLLGEIKGMPEHVIIANKEGKIFWGYESCDFIPLKKDEL